MTGLREKHTALGGPSLRPLQVAHKMYRETDRPYSTYLHTHDRYQFYCVLEGEGTAVIGDSERVLGPNKAALVMPGTPRVFQWKAGSMRYIYLIFQNRALDLRGLEDRCMAVGEAHRLLLGQLVAEMRNAGKAHSGELCEALLSALLVSLAREHDREPYSTSVRGALSGRRYEQVVAAVAAYMAQNVNRTVSRSELAEVAHMSHQHLARIFKSRTGQTLKQRHTTLRLDRACDLLRHSTIQITEIALTLGFQSFSHFTMLFKRHVGMTPSQYRCRE